MKPVWAFALWHCAFSSWEEPLQDGLLRPWRDAHGQQLYSDWSWPSNDEWLVLRDPRWVCSTPPHHYQPGLLSQGRLCSCIFAVPGQFWSHHLCVSQQKFRFIWPGCIFPVFSSLLLVSLCPLWLQISVWAPLLTTVLKRGGLATWMIKW